jgi:DNA helicase-2/ATP-dependent DNA helicase PcrA
MQELVAEKTVEAEARIENLKEFLSVTKQFENEENRPTLLGTEFDGQKDGEENTPRTEHQNENANERQDEVHEQLAETSESSLLAFLEHVALVSDVDAFDEGTEAITMMTLHSAKGLEFPVVFLVGMEEGVFPHSRALWDSAELEEERRLAYVGMTRAMERLYLTCARQRMLYGQTTSGEISRFVHEVPSELVKDLNAERDKGLAAAHDRLYAWVWVHMQGT